MGEPILLGYGCDVRCFSHNNVFEQKCYFITLDLSRNGIILKGILGKSRILQTFKLKYCYKWSNRENPGSIFEHRWVETKITFVNNRSSKLCIIVLKMCTFRITGLLLINV